MIRINIITLFALFLLPAVVFSQTISGFISDSASGERLLYAGIYEVNSSKGTTSNGYGFFSLTPPTNKEAIIVFTYVGYRPDTLMLGNLTRDTLVNIRLKAGVNLGSVEIIASNTKQAASIPGMHRLSASVIKTMPAFGGETDLIKVYQLLPGIQQGHEGTSGLHVRGGSPDQNLVMLDDVPLYNINHLGGFVSAFNTDAVKNSTLIKGGFPARYGGRLSSVLDVTMADGNFSKTEGNISLGLISSRFSLNGPIQKGKSSFLVSYRRFYLDLLAQPLAEKANPGSIVGYNFYDLNIKINKILDAKNKIYFSFYSGDDKTRAGFKEKKTDGTDYYLQTNRWGNMMAATRWNHVFNSRVFTNTTLHFTRYRVKNDIVSESGSNDDKYSINNTLLSSIGEYSLKTEIEYYKSQKLSFTSGIQLTSRSFTPNDYSYSVSGTNTKLAHGTSQKFHAFEGILYAGGKVKWPGNHELEFGTRLNTLLVDNRLFVIPEPRVKASFDMAGSLKSFVAYDLMAQNTHITGNNTIGMPVEYFLPATRTLAPSIMNQISAGLEVTSKQKIVYTAEAYYKSFNRLAMLNDGASLWEGRERWEDMFAVNGKGKSYGLELMAAKNHGNPTGWLSYTLARSTRQFDELNQGKIFPDQFDIRHSFNLAMMVKIADDADFSCAWVFNSGHGLTLPVATYLIPLGGTGENTFYNEVSIYSDRNAFRTKPYHRLDVSFNFHKQKKHYKRTFTLGIINLYNQKNPNAYYFTTTQYLDKNQNQVTRTVLMQKSFFPFMPSVSYGIKF